MTPTRVAAQQRDTGEPRQLREREEILNLVVVPAHRVARAVLEAAPGVLELALALVGLAFGGQFLVAEQLARAFLQLAADLLEAAFGAVGIHAGVEIVVAPVI